MEQKIIRWTTDSIIESIQAARVSFMRNLLHQPELDTYLEVQYDTFGLSAVKMEFLKRDLQLLAQTQLDLVHYSAFIRTTKESELAPDVPALNEFICSEIHPTFLKYITVNK
jgi:hypothetical protein